MNAAAPPGVAWRTVSRMPGNQPLTVDADSGGIADVDRTKMEKKSPIKIANGRALLTAGHTGKPARRKASSPSQPVRTLKNKRPTAIDRKILSKIGLVKNSVQSL